MATKAQVKANRQNAKKSTGPRTEDGKAHTSQNALKHGLLARDAVLPGEDPALFDRHFQDFEDTIEPQNALEFALVRQIADAEWRLRRLARIETAFLAEACDRTLRAKQNHHPDRVPTDYEGETLLMGEALRDRSQDQVNFARYKSSLCRDINRAVTLIRTLRRDEYACNENLSRKTGRRRLPKVTFPEPPGDTYPNPYDDPHRHNEPNRYDPAAADQPNRPAARIGFRPTAQPTNEPLVAQVSRPAVSALLPTQSSACGPLPPETRDTPPCRGARLPAGSVVLPADVLSTVHGSRFTKACRFTKTRLTVHEKPNKPNPAEPTWNQWAGGQLRKARRRSFWWPSPELEDLSYRQSETLRNCTWHTETVGEFLPPHSRELE